MSDLTENKREMFDGMRAYHQSEISHANHAITMLLAIAGAAGAVVSAILFSEHLVSQHPLIDITKIAWGLFITVAVLALTIATTVHIKISGDHDAYAAFGKEYVETSKRLGFYTEPDKIKTDDKIGESKGYRRTQKIIWSFAIVLIVLTLVFAVFLHCS